VKDDTRHTDDLERPALSRAAIALAWLLAATAVILILLVGASRAEAGTYRVAQCNPRLGAGHADLAFERTSDHYRGAADCGQGGAGLTVTHAASSTASGQTGSWVLDVPDGAELIRARMRVSGRAKGGHVPEVATAPGADTAASAMRVVGHAAGPTHAVRWEGPAARIEARLRCRHAECGPGRKARIAVRHVAVRLRDTRAPHVELGGPLTGNRTLRGSEQLAVAGTDGGSGVRRAYLEVNGDPAGSRDLGCELTRGIALRLRPCPREATSAFAANTAARPFHQGVNSIRACLLDYARKTGANTRCETTRVRIDNECPVDGGGQPGHIHARLQGARRAHRLTHGRHPSVVGRLTADGGEPLDDTKVCVASTPHVDGATERIVATPTTDAHGRFDARLPARPSRDVRIAYWPDEERASEQYLHLRVPASPRLRVRPRGTLHNGDRVRFRVSLPGPAAQHREVSLRARANGRWLRLRHGHTNARGRWTSRYRFHATTGERSYRFRAFVPRQPGYPYEGGRSPVRRVRVSG
jgi:hypothetical protein